MIPRCHDPEIFDTETLPADIVARFYGFLRWVNRWTGARRALRLRFEELSRGWARGASIRVLDVGAGGCDLSGDLGRWAAGRGFRLEIVALDIDLAALRYARSQEPGIRFCAGDIERLPFKDGSFDYVTASQFFHHLTDDQAIAALRAFDRIARRGIVIMDLVRRIRAWIAIKLITIPSHPIVRHDGALSVLKAFTPGEMAEIARRAGLPWLTVKTHLGHRQTLAGERPRG